MTRPRIRMIAGPNGSGKSTLLGTLANQPLNFGFYFNPDAVEADLIRTRTIDLGQWGIATDEAALRSFIGAHNLGNHISHIEWSVQANMLSMHSDLTQGYFVVVLGDFMRRIWLETKQTFTLETVMSSQNKVDLLRSGRNLGYRTYLYYVCTESALINQQRVANRVKEGGHDVPPEKVIQRYKKSLQLLPAAIRASSRAYIFDNSAKGHWLFAEYDESSLVAVSDDPPKWFAKAVLNQNDLAGK